MKMRPEDEAKKKQFEEQYADSRKERTAADIIRKVQEEMIVSLPFLNRAVLRMPFVPLHKNIDTEYSLTGPDGRKLPGTNGENLYAEPSVIIGLYRRDKVRLPRAFLHTIFHCLFCHPFRYDMLDVEKWDFAADAAVENVVLSLNRNELELDSDREESVFLRELRDNVSPFTADKIYQYYYRNPEIFERDKKKNLLLAKDAHGMWLSAEEMFGKEILTNDGVDDFESGETEMKWKNTADIIRVESEIMKRYRDDLPGAAVDNLKEIHKERQDYTEFLKKFISSREEMQVNPDEYDYIYYTYGMSLYGNMPLIEPLEYRESSRIKDLVIAIDTSGSCQGKIVRSFLNKTVTIMKTAGAFFEHMNVRILQCDSKIQSDEKITSMTEFDAYIRNLKVRGYGGTDFRPVFETVDRYIAQKEFSDLKGLLYFTDGLGTYPGIVPKYPVAFIIIEDDKEKPRVPAWAMKLITTAEELDRR